MSSPPNASLPSPLARASAGRWLAGVCAGLARFRGLPVGWLRAAFAVGALIGGIGILVYVACWLIVPAEGEEDAAPAPRGIVVFAQACAGCVGLGTLGAFAAAATVFGFGWVVLAVAATALAGALLVWPRLGPGWAVLPVAALALPSIGVAAGGVQLAAQSGEVQAAPATAADLPHAGYRSGLGRMLVDLRRTSLPATGTVPLRIHAGVRRTIVALPHDRCVHVHVRYSIAPFAARVAGLVSGRRNRPFSGVVVFGQQHWRRSGEAGNLDTGGRGPTLEITFNSEGGGLYVRDYPDFIDAELKPDWPGYPVVPEQRPDTTGTPKAAARRLIRNWRIRRRNQVRSGKRVAAQLPGPCGAKGVER